jgi:hypothetical protein
LDYNKYLIMPSSVGPNTFGEENLIFGYDLGDTINSYKGEPTENLLIGLSGHGGSWVLQSTKYNKLDVYRNTVTSPSTFNNFGFRSTTAINLNQTGVKFITISFFANIITSPGPLTGYVTIQYTDSTTQNHFWSYTPSGWESSNLLVWKRIVGRVTLNSTKTPAQIVQWYVYRDNATAGMMDVAGIQIEQKLNPTQYTQTARSSTQSLLDLTGESIIDLSSVSFDSNSQMTFDGTDDVINLSGPTIPSSKGSIEMIVSREGTISNSFIYAKVADSTNRYYVRQVDSTKFDAVRGNPLASASFGTLDLGVYYHLTMVWDDTIVYAYKNGVLQNSTTYTNPGTPATGGQLGYGPGSYCNIKLPLLKMYDRALTATEVLANYRSVKNRFNI